MTFNKFWLLEALDKFSDPYWPMAEKNDQFAFERPMAEIIKRRNPGKVRFVGIVPFPDKPDTRRRKYEDGD